MAVATDFATVDRLHARLTGGILGTARETWLARANADRPALEPCAVWEHLEILDRGRSNSPATVDSHIESAAGALQADRVTLVTILNDPEQVLRQIRAKLGAGTTADRVWAWICWLTEAVWQVVDGEPLPHPYTRGDQQLLRPVAARLRFLVLAEPFRHDAEPGSVDKRRGKRGWYGIAFGNNTAHEFEARARAARFHWQECLGEFQAHPLLASASPREIETELDLIAFRDGSGRGRPLILSWSAWANPSAPMTAGDRAAATDLVERHLLPRFRIGRVARLSNGCAELVGGRVAGPVAAAPLVIAAALAAVTLVAFGRFAAAWVVAIVAFGLLGVGVVTFGRMWAAQWLLRLPAASAVGLVLLVALAPSWWQSPALRSWQAPGVLLAASFGYLVVEARNHGVGRFAAMARALAVTIVGGVHALLVALIGLVAIAPSYSENALWSPDQRDYDLADLWRSPDYANQARSVLVLATAWCLAVGVFSQILWDDRPITAPLAHLRWRRERKT